jgi:succinylarginine dihydrolase
MPAREVNFDGLVGPNHNYAGLSHGNLASQAWKGKPSNPRAAALEGLAKMKRLAEMGIPQAVLPPQERPNVPALRGLGFTGSDKQVIERAAKFDPVIFAACCSASAMWTANAATVSPSSDTADRRVHFTPANLLSHFHRSLETAQTTAVLRKIFADRERFEVHPPLPASTIFSDEGAANHLRLASADADVGYELFVYGQKALDPTSPRPTRFVARQTFEACTAIARRHGLRADRTIFLRQNPAAIDAGAFHCDVVAVANQNVMLSHAAAFAPDDRQRLQDLFRQISDESGQRFHLIEAEEADLPLAEAIRSYVFNSQLVTRPDGGMTLIAPAESEESPAAKRYIDRVLASQTSANEVEYVEVRQSMRNGGGPACLRLRVVLTDAEIARVHQGVLLTDALHAKLTQWVQKHYREQLTPADLADPKLLEESRAALDELSGILDIGLIYAFQN